MPGSLCIDFFQQLSEMGVIILLLCRWGHWGSDSLNYLPKHKSKLLKCGSFRIWTPVSNSRACGDVLSTLPHCLKKALWLALGPGAQTQPTRWANQDLVGEGTAQGTGGSFALGRGKGLMAQESSFCSEPRRNGSAVRIRNSVQLS